MTFSLVISKKLLFTGQISKWIVLVISTKSWPISYFSISRPNFPMTILVIYNKFIFIQQNLYITLQLSKFK